MTRAPIRDIHLPAGEFYFGRGQVRVHTLLGTCVAIVLWHPEKRIGGICHYLLPARTGPADPSAAGPGLYADGAVALFDKAVKGANTRPAEYRVKLAGGGNMFPGILAKNRCPGEGCDAARRANCQNIGCRNVEVAHTLLRTRGYTVASECTGGLGSRQLIFELWSGDVWVRRGVAMATGPQVAA